MQRASCQAWTEDRSEPGGKPTATLMTVTNHFTITLCAKQCQRPKLFFIAREKILKVDFNYPQAREKSETAKNNHNGKIRLSFQPYVHPTSMAAVC